MFRQDREEFGDWKILKCLGTGGNGEVHLWQNRITRQKVAIKSLKFPPDRDDEKERKRWRDEIAFAKRIRHPNIVAEATIQPSEFQVFLRNRYPPEPLVMEYCEKGDLRGVLSKMDNLNGLPETEIRNILKCLRDAIFYLHSLGVTHRDIKPENLVIKEVNGSDVYKLTDLGYAREIIATIEASHVGTFEYFAPEVITEPSYSNTVDYWSMGIIAFEIICGLRPFLPGSPLMDFIERIKSKDSEHIAITRTDSNEYKYHSTLFEQNQISSCLRQLLERWLRIPLSINPRQRAIFADTNESVSFSSQNRPSQQSGAELLAKLKIFKDLDYALTAKILTVFCMFNLRQYSYIVNENTTRKGFLETLSLDTKIPVEDLVIIPPPDNTTLNRFGPNTKPIELFIEDLYDKPMVYCATDRDTLSDTSQNAGMSALLVKALEENALKNRRHAVQVVRHMLFYVQIQGKYSTMFLQGLLNYAVTVDDWVVRFEGRIEMMATMFWQLQGAIDFFTLQVKQAKEMINEKNITATIADDSNEIVERCKQIRELFFRTRNRYISMLRRSKGIINELNVHFNSFLSTIERASNLSTINEIYNKCRDNYSENASTLEVEIFRFFNAFQESNWFLHSPQIKHIQTTISEIHIEFELIETVVDGLIKQQTESLQSINQLGSTFNKSLWKIAVNAAADTVNDGPNIPDIDRILSSPKVNGDGSLSLKYLSFNDEPSMISISSDVQTIVEENDKLCDKVQRLLKSRILDD